MSKRLISVFAALALACSALTACGSEQNDSGTAQTTTAAAAATTTTTQKAEETTAETMTTTAQKAEETTASTTKKAEETTTSTETQPEAAEPEKTDSETEQPTRKIIIDTDTGADDASALILAAKSKNIEILGVTTLLGNVDLEQSTQNAIMALETAGCDAPVYKGAAETFNGKLKDAFSVFGADGMGEADLIHPTRSAEEKDAVSFILDTVRENPGEVELVVLGPVTNIALAIQKDPETMKQVKMIWSMGTAGLGPGNASPVAEFNIYGDAEAYKIMLDSGIPVTIIGLDMCDGEAMWTDEQFKELNELNDTGRFVSSSFGKIREFYAENGSDTVMNCDCVAMSCVVDSDFVKGTIQAHGSCITDEGETYAMVIFYKEGMTYDLVDNDFDYNVTLVTEVDKANYFELFKNAIS